MKNVYRVCFCFLTALLLSGPLSVSQTSQAEFSTISNASECSEPPRENRLPVIASMAGASPVWVVDAAFGVWPGSDKPVKTVWVVARSHQGDLRVTGRRLDGPGRAQFKKGVYGSIVDELVIPNAHRMGVIPGGASSDVVRDHAFHPSYVIYPSSGCWELVARMGGDEVKVVINMKDARR